MVMKAEPFFACGRVDLPPRRRPAGPAVVLLSPRGRRFDQETARALRAARAAGAAVRALRGRRRARRARAGDRGAEPRRLRADRRRDGRAGRDRGRRSGCCRARSATRARPRADSFEGGLLDWPHYTRPAEWRGHAVPEVLLSGDHGRVRRWRRQEALRATRERRPDLLAAARLLGRGRAAAAGDRGRGRGGRTRGAGQKARRTSQIGTEEDHEGHRDCRVGGPQEAAAAHPGRHRARARARQGDVRQGGEGQAQGDRARARAGLRGRS